MHVFLTSAWANRERIWELISMATTNNWPKMSGTAFVVRAVIRICPKT